MLVKIIALLLAALTVAEPGNVYTAWTDTGMHLCICDNGTPDDPEDDWIVDWEDNRDFEIVVRD